METLIALPATLLALVLPPAGAAELRVLSAGAVEPGLRPALAAFEQTSGHRVQLTFATAPQIRGRGKSGGFDLVIAPPAVLDELEGAMQIDADHALRVSVGRVGLAWRCGRARRCPTSRRSNPSRSRCARPIRWSTTARPPACVETLLARLGIDARNRSTRYRTAPR